MPFVLIHGLSAILFNVGKIVLLEVKAQGPILLAHRHLHNDGQHRVQLDQYAQHLSPNRC